MTDINELRAQAKQVNAMLKQAEKSEKKEKRIAAKAAAAKTTTEVLVGLVRSKQIEQDVLIQALRNKELPTQVMAFLAQAE